MTPSSFDKLIERINATGSSHEKDNRTLEELEPQKLRKENQQQRKGWVVSRRKIGRIMKKRGLVSAYTCK